MYYFKYPLDGDVVHYFAEPYMSFQCFSMEWEVIWNRRLLWAAFTTRGRYL